MKDKCKASENSWGQKKVRLFCFALIAAAIFVIIGLYLGNPFEDYTTAATL